jgi:hypothetical protein
MNIQKLTLIKCKYVIYPTGNSKEESKMFTKASSKMHKQTENFNR